MTICDAGKNSRGKGAMTEKGEHVAYIFLVSRGRSTRRFYSSDRDNLNTAISTQATPRPEGLHTYPRSLLSHTHLEVQPRLKELVIFPCADGSNHDICLWGIVLGVS